MRQKKFGSVQYGHPYTLGVVKLLEAIKRGMENENEILAPVSIHGSGRALVCHQWEGLQLAALDPRMSVSLGSSPAHYMVLSVW